MAKPGDLVVREDQVYALMDREDEADIVAGIVDAHYQPAFAYSYEIGGKTIVGISSDGAKQIALMLGNIRADTGAIRVDEREDYFYGIVSVTDLTRNVTLPGVGRQCKFIVGEGNKPTDRLDEHAFVKAITKAVRNGILNIADQKMIAEIISKLDPKAIKRLSAPPGAKAPTAEQRLKELRNRLHANAEKSLGEGGYDRVVKPEMMARFKVDSNTKLTEPQLMEMLVFIDQEAARQDGTPASKTAAATASAPASKPATKKSEPKAEPKKTAEAKVDKDWPLKRPWVDKMMKELGLNRNQVREKLVEVSKSENPKDWTPAIYEKTYNAAKEEKDAELAGNMQVPPGADPGVEDFLSKYEQK